MTSPEVERTVASGGPRPATSQAQDCGFVINGRFLSQPTTGVQRYAGEITQAIDAELHRRNRTGTVLTPRLDRAPPSFKALRTVAAGPGRGHAWEQAVLPVRSRKPLLNLCNTAPALGPEQVVCIHDANVFIQPESYGRAFRWTYRALQPLLIRRGARITTVSRSSAEQLAAHLPIAAKDVVVLPNGHEHALRWNAAASTLLTQHPARRPFVLLLGSRARHKNAALIIGLADVLDDLGLDLFVAGGQSGIFAPTEDVAKPNLRWLGVVSDNDLALLLGNALCLAFPSFTEGFGLPIVEAMALGCPVVSSDRASLPEVCGSAALLASPDAPDQWVSHFRTLAGSASLRGALRDQGLEQARRYSWAASARGYLDLLASGGNAP